MRFPRFLAAFFIAFVADDATAKCMPLRLGVGGEVVGDIQGLSVRASALPSDRARSVSADLDSSEFEIALIFDTYSGSGFFGGDRCRARPKEVRVAVVNHDKVLETRVLRWEDFAEESVGRYILRSKLKFFVPPTTGPN